MEDIQTQTRKLYRQEVLRVVLAGSMVTVGLLHFIRSAQFVQIVPAMLPHPLLLVYISGVFEVIGGLYQVNSLMRQIRSP